MKKIILTLAAAIICAATVSAQSWVDRATSASNWNAGIRIGSGFQVQAEYNLPSDNYLEGRFGMSWCNGGASLMADFTALYNWHLFDMDWTPDLGTWFFDAGCGIDIGGRSHYAYFGLAGSAKFGIAFNGAPFKVAIDWTPYIGPGIAYGGGSSHASFNEYGFANFGISCVYCF